MTRSSLNRPASRISVRISSGSAGGRSRTCRLSRVGGGVRHSVGPSPLGAGGAIIKGGGATIAGGATAIAGGGHISRAPISAAVLASSGKSCANRDRNALRVASSGGRTLPTLTLGTPQLVVPSRHRGVRFEQRDERLLGEDGRAFHGRQHTPRVELPSPRQLKACGTAPARPPPMRRRPAARGPPPRRSRRSWSRRRSRGRGPEPGASGTRP